MSDPRPKRIKHNISGWINLDKPYDMTSTQAVGAVKRILSPMKIGHAGTLDPLATGVLPLALGAATKTVQYMMDADKIYHFTIRFGVSTDTDDSEGDVVSCSDVRPSDEAIRAALPEFTGEIAQLPPRYSAIKINGQRAYDLARAGEEVALQPRMVRIDNVRMIERIDADHATFSMQCGKGTYVRSLARDMSEMLGTYGHISALRRTQVGSFTADDAITLDKLEEYATQSNPQKTEYLQPIERALDDIPAVLLDHTQSQALRHGQVCLVSPASWQDAQDGLYQARHGNVLVALVQRSGQQCAPMRVFHQ